MWSPPRRAQVAALAVCASLALLLLHALPPAAAPPPPPPPAPVSLRLGSSTTSTTPPAPPPPANETSAAPPPPPPPRPPAVPAAPAAKPGVMLTGAVYEAGHSRPHPELCPSLGAELRLVVLIASAPDHASARDAIRLTWGHYAARTDLAIAFVIGALEPSSPVEARLEQEDKLYGDLIRGRSLDTYSNLTLKTLSMLEWVDTYCPRAPLLLKTDDDMFINIPRLLRFADKQRDAAGTIWGRVIRRSLPKRTTKSKYYVSSVQYAGKWYPDFATGPAYLLTRDVIPRLLAAAPQQPYLRLEDVFVTGVLSSLLGIKRQHDAQFYNKRVSPHPCAVQRGIAIHMVRYHEQFDLWRKLLDGKTVCKQR